MSTKIDYDEVTIKEIKSKLSKRIMTKDADEWSTSSLQYCITLIEDLVDENGSLWFMLEELKESKWTKENSTELSKTIQRQIAMLKLLQSRKGEA